MTTSYIVKRCNTITFAKSFKYLNMKFDDTELNDPNKVIYIGDTRPDTTDDELYDHSLYEFTNHPINIADISKINTSIDPIVIIELARGKTTTIAVPNEVPNDLDKLDTINYSSLHMNDDDAIAEFSDALRSYIDDNEYLNDKQLSRDFIDYLMLTYMHLRDGNNKLAILKLLSNNNIDTSDIEQRSPIQYKEVDVFNILPTSQFEDIKIVINKDDVNAHSGSSVYKHSPDELKKAAVGNSTQLEAFSRNKFTVIHNKKSANIENHIYKRNHDVLDSLARNGVVCSPNTDNELSIHLLMKQLHRFKHFDIVFIHPSYELKITRAESPSELIEPSYLVNEGELLAVVYRYICLYFFGYCSVFDEEMEEFSYLI